MFACSACARHRCIQRDCLRLPRQFFEFLQDDGRWWEAQCWGSARGRPVLLRRLRTGGSNRCYLCDNLQDGAWFPKAALKRCSRHVHVSVGWRVFRDRSGFSGADRYRGRWLSRDGRPESESVLLLLRLCRQPLVRACRSYSRSTEGGRP